MSCYVRSNRLVWELRSFGRHRPLKDTSGGTAFYGTDATLITDDTRSGETPHGSREANFPECIKTRKQANALLAKQYRASYPLPKV